MSTFDDFGYSPDPFTAEVDQLELVTWDHGDPFDRLIAAQALIEGATLITSDDAMQRFEPLSTLW